MNLFFLIPLAIVPVALFIFKNSADEMAYLSAAISAVGLILSLVLAPWQIQIFLLAVVAIAARKLWLSAMSQEESEPEKEIKLSYRGVNYEHKSAEVKLTGDEIKGKYRGQVWKSPIVEEPTIIKPTFTLKYRGASVNYQKSVTSAIAQTDAEEKPLTLAAPKLPAIPAQTKAVSVAQSENNAQPQQSIPPQQFGSALQPVE